MAPVQNGRVLFNEVPTGYPEPGKTTIYDNSKTIDLENVDLNGGFLIKVLVLSIDPYMRGRMRDAKVKTYNNPFTIGESYQATYGPYEHSLDNYGVGVVLRSDNAAVKAGSYLYGTYSFQQYVIRNDLENLRVVENKEGLPLSAYVGICGMPGETAYYAWKEYANAKPGEIAFVSTGAGAVGATVVQLAKADGLKVIASAGSDDKVEYIKSLGADVAFNYKTTDTREVLEKEGPINVYWDNVGGKTLETVLLCADKGARLIECGMITAYNGGGAPINNAMQIVSKELHIHGFIVGTLRSKYAEEFYTAFVARVARGEIKYKEYRVNGLENAGQGILDVQTGINFGKAVIVVAEQ